MLRYTGLVFFFTFLLLPIYEMLMTSLKPLYETHSIPSTLFPHQFYYQNYLQMWKTVPNLPRYLLNSFFIASIVAVFAILLAIPASYVIARHKFPGRREILLSTLIINLFSPVVLLAPLYTTMRFLGLLNTYWAIIVPTAAFALPFNIWMLTGFFDTIPVELEEAAAIDGASKPQILSRIVLPLAAPGLAAVAIYAFIAGWSQFIFAISFNTQDSLMPITQGLYKFLGQHELLRWNELMGASLVATLPVIILFIYLQKYLVRGLTVGAIKG